MGARKASSLRSLTRLAEAAFVAVFVVVVVTIVVNVVVVDILIVETFTFVIVLSFFVPQQDGLYDNLGSEGGIGAGRLDPVVAFNPSDI